MLDFSVHSLLLALLQGIITKHHTHTTTRETTGMWMPVSVAQPTSIRILAQHP